MSRSVWVLLILVTVIVGGAFFFAGINTQQPVQTISIPVTPTSTTNAS
jgi:hypothetical protein